MFMLYYRTAIMVFEIRKLIHQRKIIAQLKLQRQKIYFTVS